MADPAGEAPPSVRTASVLLWVLVGLIAVRTLTTIVLFDDLIDAYAEGDASAGLPRDAVEDAAPAYVSTAVFTFVVLGGLLALCAVYVRRAAGWARIVATMFASLAALAGLLVLLQPSTPLFTVLGLLNAAVAVAVVVQLYSRSANDFFRAQRGRRPSRPYA